MKKQLYIFSFIVAMISNNALAFDELSLFDETDEASKWTYIEKKFISDIATWKKQTWTHVSAAIPVLVGLAALYKINFPVAEDQDILKTALKPTNTYSIISAGAGIILTVQILECYLENQAHRNTITDFFNNWDQNQFYIPKELEEGFDILAERIELQGQDAILEDAHEIVETIQFLVMRHFEKRYEKVLQGTAINSLTDAKTAGEIFKNAVETGGKFAGGK